MTQEKRGGGSFYGHAEYRWAIYPDYWPKKWGPTPLLGHVFADDEFYAVREAWAKNVCPQNSTFQPLPVKVGVAKPRNYRN